MRPQDAKNLQSKWHALLLHASIAHRELRDFSTAEKSNGLNGPYQDQQVTGEAQVSRAEVVLALAEQLVEQARFATEPPGMSSETWRGSTTTCTPSK